MLDIDNYQKQAMHTAIYRGKGTVDGLVYCALGLGESGEVQGKVKKILRDDEGILTVEKRDQIAKELGDVLWYVAATASELGLDLSEVARLNLLKLQKRAQDNTLRGSGDDR